MKANYECFVLIFLLASPLTEKEACKSSEDGGNSGKRPWVGHARQESAADHGHTGPNVEEGSSLSKSPAAKTHPENENRGADDVKTDDESQFHIPTYKYKAVDPAGPNDVMDTEDRWWGDHKLLHRVGSNSEVLGPKKEHDSAIESIRKPVEAFETSDSLCPTPTTYYSDLIAPEEELLPEELTSWHKFAAGISNCNTYSKDGEIVDELLNDMANMEIKNVANQEGGTQMKFRITFENGQQAIFKPTRFSIDYEGDPNQFHYDHMERGIAEIATFHVDRLLDFRRAVPAVGRVLSISNDLTAKSDELTLKYYKSPGNNLCIEGTCEKFCGTAHALCGNPDQIQGSVQVMVPPKLQENFEPSLYSRKYGSVEQSEFWRHNEDFCHVFVMTRTFYEESNLLPYVVDLHILDFIIGNQDRHGFLYFALFRTREAYIPYIVPMDNGKGFVTTEDDFDILAPLKQCCVFHPSTVKTLLGYYFGERTLGQKLNDSLHEDASKPVLPVQYLIAVDRRVEEILRVVAKCIKNAGGILSNVLMNHFDQKTYRPVKATERRMVNEPKSKADIIVAESEQRKQTSFQHRKIQNRLVSTRTGERVSIPKPEVDENLKKILYETWKVQEYDLEHDVECPKETTYQQMYDEEGLKKTEAVLTFRESSPNSEEWWNEFLRQVSNCHTYPKQGDNVQHLLLHMSKADVTEVGYLYSSSQLCLTLKLKEGQMAIFKPMRFSRYYETNKDHFYFDDFERPHAEIAAFHLDRLLGFRRALPTIGRVLKIPKEEHWRKKTNPFYDIKMYKSPAGRRCLDPRNQCTKYCDTAHAICANGDNLIQGAVQVWLGQYSSKPGFATKRWQSPYYRNFSDYKITTTLTDDDYCDTLKQTPPYNHGRRLLDLIDLYVSDYITGNQERDHYYTVSISPGDTDGFIAHIDNGKGFGNPREDDQDDKDDYKNILAPLTQCCVVRPSTVKTLLKFYLGEDSLSLAQELEKSLRPDPTYPVLATKYFLAIDRRVGKVLRAVANCLEKKKDLNAVLMNHFPPKSHSTRHKGTVRVFDQHTAP